MTCKKPSPLKAKTWLVISVFLSWVACWLACWASIFATASNAALARGENEFQGKLF